MAARKLINFSSCNYLGVTDETTSGGTEVQVPQTERTVCPQIIIILSRIIVELIIKLTPRGRESELTIRGDDNVLDDVRVSNKLILVQSQRSDR